MSLYKIESQILDSKYTKHKSVLLNEVIENLNINDEESTYVADLTFGGGGHTRAILEEYKKINLIAFDQDPDAVKNAESFLLSNSIESRVELINKNFKEFSNSVGDKTFGAIIADLGVSSHHFDSFERGFSFRVDADLDMRMDYKNNKTTAADIVNTYDEEDLTELFSDYGEERFSKRIAQNIVSERSKKIITTTKELENIIFHSYPKNMRFGKINPSTRVFQALRIAVNRELEVLTDVIPQALKHLDISGRLMIISFHSLEDRIVKRAFKNWSINNTNYRIITKKPIIPQEDEIVENSRARSAKMRVIERSS